MRTWSAGGQGGGDQRVQLVVMEMLRPRPDAGVAPGVDPREIAVAHAAVLR